MHAGTIRPMAKRKPPSGREEVELLEPSIVQLVQELRVLRLAIDEFRVDFAHLLRNLPDNLPPPYRHLTTLAEAFAAEHSTDRGSDSAADLLRCYECDTDPPPSLAQALRDGWIDVAFDDESSAFVGWCPACQQAHELEERRLNAGPVDRQPVKEIESKGTSRKTLFD